MNALYILPSLAMGVIITPVLMWFVGVPLINITNPIGAPVTVSIIAEKAECDKLGGNFTIRDRYGEFELFSEDWAKGERYKIECNTSQETKVTKPSQTLFVKSVTN